ncbi:MAG: polysaccharide deacetylase family protein [Spirochaetaceae bacterium]|nr:polysaccharide deacetylase family protein [Spirochaetaceae bacterium]
MLLVPACIGSAPASAAGKAFILDYHTFLSSGSSSMDFDLETLAGQLDRFTTLGYRFVSLEDAIAGRIEGEANIVVTIDDGHRTVAEAYDKVFAPRGIRPTLFVYPAVIGRTGFSLGRDELRRILAAGCGLGSHGYHHEYLTAQAFAEDPRKARGEIERTGPALERLTGTRPRLFAFPFGVGSAEAEELLARNGFEYAFLAGDSLVAVDFADPSLRKLAVPRTIVYRWNAILIFAELEKRNKARLSLGPAANSHP